MVFGQAKVNHDGAAGDRLFAASILIVEDDPLVASSVQGVLEELHYKVVAIASSGPEAMSVAGNAYADLALVDIRLPGTMDGIEVAEQLLARFKLRSIFLSGAYDAETMSRARRVGSLGFLAKPFRPSQVFNAVERALARSSEEGDP